MVVDLIVPKRRHRAFYREVKKAHILKTGMTLVKATAPEGFSCYRAQHDSLPDMMNVMLLLPEGSSYVVVDDFRI